MARPPIVGADAVARQARLFGSRFAALGIPAIVNGGAGVVVRIPGRPPLVAGFTVVNGRITAIDLNGDPAKVGGIDIA